MENILTNIHNPIINIFFAGDIVASETATIHSHDSDQVITVDRRELEMLFASHNLSWRVAMALIDDATNVDPDVPKWDIVENDLAPLMMPDGDDIIIWVNDDLSLSMDEQWLHWLVDHYL